MWPDWISNPGSLTYESGVLPTALRGPARAPENRTRWKGIIAKSSGCPNDQAKLWDRLDKGNHLELVLSNSTSHP